MSFDSTFNYAPLISGTNTTIADLQSKVVAVNAEIATLTGITGYAATAAKLTELNQLKATLDQQIASQQVLLAELNVCNNLTAPQKAKIYSFYLLCGDVAKNFQLRLLFNSAAMLADEQVDKLINDTIDHNCKCMVGKLLYSMFPLNSANLRSITSLFRYSV